MELIALVIHFLADFLLQSREMGEKKSSSIEWLGKHVLIVLICFLPFGIEFAVLNAGIHAIIDGSIWNIYKISVYNRFPEADENYEYWKDSWFYTTIGLDQLLHVLTILILFKVL